MKDSIVCSLIGLAKFTLAGLITLLFRLITPLFGLSNVTPLMATELAGAKAYGPLVAGLYGAFGIVILDALTCGIGPWTWNVSICYSLVGVLGGLFMKGRPVKRADFLLVSLVGTLFFDFATGIVPTLIHGETLLESLMLQAPFTARHLGGNLFFACFSPWFYYKIMANSTLEIKFIFRDIKAYGP